MFCCCLLAQLGWFIHSIPFHPVHQSLNLLGLHTHTRTQFSLEATAFPLVVYKSCAVCCLPSLHTLSTLLPGLSVCLWVRLLRQHIPKRARHSATHYSTAVTLLHLLLCSRRLRFMGLQMRQKLQLQLLTQNRKRIPSSVQYLLKIITETTPKVEEEEAIVVVVFAVDHSACLFVQTFVNFIELSLSPSLSKHIPSITRQIALMNLRVAVEVSTTVSVPIKIHFGDYIVRLLRTIHAMIVHCGVYLIYFYLHSRSTTGRPLAADPISI